MLRFIKKSLLWKSAVMAIVFVAIAAALFSAPMIPTALAQPIPVPVLPSGPPIVPIPPSLVPPTATPQAPSGGGVTLDCGVTTWFSSPLKCAVAWTVYIIATIIAFVGALFIAIEVWFIQIILQINTSVVQQTLVQTGFTVTLALANLGFVLGIIVIALATILHSQSYGLKQILWKLVVAAILVNFSLVICGAIIGFSNTLTNYFMAPLGGVQQFASSIGSLFQPQQFFNPNVGAANSTDIQSIFGAAGNAVGSFIAPIVTIITALIFVVAIVIVLATFFLMLVVRYVYLAFLLIFMPLAWVCWVFPMLKGHWSKWWSTFLRWTFFPPIVVFFLYLVILTGNTLNRSGASVLTGAPIPVFTSSSSNPVMAAISSFFGALFTNILTTALNDVLLIGLAVGGLIAANSMSIKFADAGMKTFGRAKDGILGYSNRVRQKTQRGIIQGSGRAKEKLQEGKYFGGRAKALQGAASKITPDLKKAQENLQTGKAGWSRYIPGILRRPMGDVLAGAEFAGGGALVAENRKQAAEAVERDPKAAARLLQNKPGSKVAGRALTQQEQIAYLEQTTKNPEFLKAVRAGGVEGMDFAEWMQKNEGRLDNYHVDKETKEKLQDKSGLTKMNRIASNDKIEPRVHELEGIGKTKKDAEREAELGLRKSSAKGLDAAQTKELADADTEMADIEGKRSRGIISEYEKKRLPELKERKEELEKIKKGGLTDEEEKELQSLASRQQLTDTEEKELAEKKKVMKENDKKIAEVDSKDPDGAQELFQDNEAARTKFVKENPGKALPLMLDPRTLKLMQDGTMKAMIRAFSPYNMRAVVDAIGKKNNLGHLESALQRLVGEMGENQVRTSLNGNKELKRWMQNNSALGIIDWVDILKLPKTKNYKKQKAKGEGVDDDEDDDD